MVYDQFTWVVVNSEHSMDDQTLEDLSADSEVSKCMLRAMLSHARSQPGILQPVLTPAEYYGSDLSLEGPCRSR